jgi:hypothetical protein
MSLRHLEGGTNLVSGYTFHDGDESGATYDYFGYLKADGGCLIMRVTKDSSQIRYFVGVNYSVDWAARTSKTYTTIA